MGTPQQDYDGLTAALAAHGLHHVLLFNHALGVRVEFEGTNPIYVDWERQEDGAPDYAATAALIAEIVA